MRTPWISGFQALAERLVAKDQIDDTVPESGMPPYMESFLAHLSPARRGAVRLSGARLAPVAERGDPFLLS